MVTSLKFSARVDEIVFSASVNLLCFIKLVVMDKKASFFQDVYEVVKLIP
ncbi:MAG: hypothetical protein ACI9RP_002188, partial [Cyclobacteriaceae bacterium]